MKAIVGMAMGSLMVGAIIAALYVVAELAQRLALGHW